MPNVVLIEDDTWSLAGKFIMDVPDEVIEQAEHGDDRAIAEWAHLNPRNVVFLDKLPIVLRILDDVVDVISKGVKEVRDIP